MTLSSNKSSKLSIFSERVRTLREAKHLTQEQLSIRVGVSKTAVVAWEAGKNKPRPQTLDLLCKALNANKSQLTGEEPLPAAAIFSLEIDVPDLRKNLEIAGDGIKKALSALKKLDK